MSKKLLALLFLVVTICTSIFIGSDVKAVLAIEYIATESKNVDFLTNVNRNAGLYEKVIDTYKIGTAVHDGKNFDVYFDDYAGVFIDEQGLLNIALVTDSRKRQLNYSQNELVVYRYFTFSYNKLQEIMNEIELVMIDFDILAVGIDEEVNQVFVELNNGNNVSQIVSYLEDKKLYHNDAINFVVDLNAKVENTAFGGESISRPAGPGMISRGTIGAWAIDNVTGQLGIITNEHVAPLDATMSYRGHYNVETGSFSNYVSLGITSKAQNGGTVDAAFVPFSNQANWTITPYGKYYNTAYSNVRLGNNNHIIKGHPIFRIGQTTGATSGTIKDANVSVTVDGIKKTNTFRFSNAPERGDSGGPVYYNDGTNLYLIGLTFATGNVFLGGKQGWACRIQNVMSTLNVTPITNDSFNTTNHGTDIQLNEMNIIPVGAFNIPANLAGKNVISLGVSAFANQSGITRFQIPASVTTIGSNAFFNTNSAPINLVGRTNAPITFDLNWNSSNNPVYLSGSLCQHTTKTYVNLNSTQHGRMCITCRTMTNIESHSYNYSWKNYKQHYSNCQCGEAKLVGHVVSSSDPGFPYKTCLHCGGPAEMGFVQQRGIFTILFDNSLPNIQMYFGNGSYILSNGVIVISDDDLDGFYSGTLEIPCFCCGDNDLPCVEEHDHELVHLH